MPLYEITTRSTFEHKYLISANSLEEAHKELFDEENFPDFHQKHLGEKVTEYNILDEGTQYTDWATSIRSQGYF